MSSTRKFGVTSVSGEIGQGCIANSLDFTNEVETAEARNEKGQIIDIAAFSKKTSVSIRGLYTNDGVEPGSVITIDGKDFLVTSANKTESNTAFQECTVNATTADEAELWPLSSVIQ